MLMALDLLHPLDCALLLIFIQLAGSKRASRMVFTIHDLAQQFNQVSYGFGELKKIG